VQGNVDDAIFKKQYFAAAHLIHRKELENVLIAE
jgi:hypothetical protein